MSTTTTERPVELSDDTPPAAPRHLAMILCVAQVVATAVCSVASVAPAVLPIMGRAHIVLQLAMSVALLVVGLKHAQRQRLPILIGGGAVLFAMALPGRFLLGEGSVEVFLDNTARLGLPLCVALVFAKFPDLIPQSVLWLRRYARTADACAVIALLLMVYSRSQGENGMWPGYPVHPLMAFPLIFQDRRVSFLRLILYSFAIVLSGRRWALVVWALAIFVGVLLMRGRRLESAFAVVVGVMAVWYVLVLNGLSSSVVARTTSALNVYRSGTLATATSATPGDAAIGQRLEEIRADVGAMFSSPSSVLLGRELNDIELADGKPTHAIHCTPAFLVARGGLLWVLAFVTLPRSRRTAKLPAPMVIGMGTILVGSFAGNATLDPGFLLALAALNHRRFRPAAMARSG